MYEGAMISVCYRFFSFVVCAGVLVVYCTIRSLCGGCIYKRFDVMAVRVWCLPIYVISGRHKGLPEDDVLTSKHVAANDM